MTKQAAPFSAHYTSADGVSKRSTFKTLDGLAAFVDKWAGRNVNGNTAVSNDGIGKVVFNGATEAQLTAFWTPAPAPVAPVPAPAPAAAAVALRGGLAVVAVALGKPYRVQAGHNLQWLTQVQQAVAAGGGSASVQALLAAGVPAPFVGYMVRRGYAVPVSAK